MNKGRGQEAENWMNQAFYDLKAVQWNLKGEFFNTVCFLSQQASEKALKSLVYFSVISRKKLLTHSVFELMKLTIKVIPELQGFLDDARELDLHYIPSRYPNGLVSGYPHQFYGESTAEHALKAAERIINVIDQYLISKGFERENQNNPINPNN